jgi:P-type Cu+ transporter
MKKTCFHCGGNFKVVFKKKLFCCWGCKEIYKILQYHKLHKFYELNAHPGMIPKNNRFDFLDEKKIREKLVDFENDKITLIRLSIPSIHCSSCIWILESLPKIHPGIIQSTVNFTTKKVCVIFNHKKLTLSKLADFLSKLGYIPNFNEKSRYNSNKKLIYKIVISFFCFGNIMLLAIPEYIGSGDKWLIENKYFFRILMLILSFPVLFFSSANYLQSAYFTLKNKCLNIDFPICLGILTIFWRSIYEITSNLGPGYLDSLTGLVFFLLLGEFFQKKTNQYLSKDYKYFYPISIIRLRKGIEENIFISSLRKGDRILIRNEEIIPTDSILIRGTALIDNSFITGESKLVVKKIGDRIFAGGKQKGESIELEVIEKVDQSYLSQLWNNEVFQKKTEIHELVNKWSKYFTIITLAITLLTGLYWSIVNPCKLFKTVSSVLIVACPCALAISMPFILGNIMRILAKKNFFVRDVYTIERISQIKTLVFDKTGTITESNKSKISFVGKCLTKKQIILIASLVKNSKHPFSRKLYKFLYTGKIFTIRDFKEIPGKGLEANINGMKIKVGSAKYIIHEKEPQKENQSRVFVSIKRKVLGYFLFLNFYRKKLNKIFEKLADYKIIIISGDNDSEKSRLETLLPKKSIFFFEQSPKEKLYRIKYLQKIGEKIMMFGDGLNDSVALKQSDVGVAVSEDINNFSPNCDVLMKADSFDKIFEIIQLSKIGIFLVRISFIISISYNIIGLSLAIMGYLRPIIAAILMPLSSISIIVFSLISTKLWGYYF